MASSNRSRPDPFEQTRRSSNIAARQYFTDRTDFIAAFQRHLEIDDPDELHVLVFFGVGGIGKSALQQKLAAELDETKPRVPYAQFNLENVRDTTQAYREVMLRLRTDLERFFSIQFPNFDLCLAVILGQESGSEVPLLHIRPGLKDLFAFAVDWLPVSTDSVESMLRRELPQFPVLESWIRRAGGTSDAIDLRRRARQNDPLLGDELILRFAMDLRDGLPERGAKACRGVLFLDTYESLWVDREAGKAAQSRRLDHWVRELAKFCLAAGVLLVICGRDRLEWAAESEDDPNWQKDLEQHLIGGLSAHDAQAFLAKCGIGPPADQCPSPLQQAIQGCCDEDPDRESLRCHTLFLRLCAEIVLNHRRTKGGEDPPVTTFSGVPNDNVANALALRFLKSLHHRGLEMWIEELSLTPRFDEQAALALSAARQHNVGRADWELLTGFSFVEGPDAEGFYRLHKTMRRVLTERVERGSDADGWEAVHRWFVGYWTTREVASLSWFHRWTLDAEGALRDWITQHRAALNSLNTAKARELLTWWSETGLDETERRRHGDQLWALTNFLIGCAYAEAVIAPRREVLLCSISHFQAAMQVFTEGEFSQVWAATQSALGNAYTSLPTGNRSANLQRAIDCYEAALRVYTEADFPRYWACVQNNLGNAYRELPTIERSANVERAIQCIEAALRVSTKAKSGQEWALLQTSLGNAYGDLPTGDRSRNLQIAIDCYRAALEVFTAADSPSDWARTQHNLGVAYDELPTGDRNANLQCAIDCFHAALQVYTEAESARLWARAQNNLGNAYRNLPTGDRSANCQRAIDCHRLALRLYTEADFPYDRGVTQISLGNDYLDLPTGDRDDNLRRAIDYYQDALRVYTETELPQGWAVIQNNLGLAYSHLKTGVRDDNLRRAIACCEAALRVRTEADFPQEWASTQSNLGLAYSNLPTGDRNENLWRAINCYLAALRVLTEADFPRGWAMVQSRLSRAYTELPTGSPDENAQRAVDCCQAALRVYTETDFSEEWADTQQNLGLAYSNLPTGDRSENLRRAVDCCQAALRVYNEVAFPQEWARVTDLLKRLRTSLESEQPPSD